MRKMIKYRDYVVDTEYTIYAQGFSDPIIGKITEINISEAEDEVLLVIEQKNGELKRVLVRAITGWSSPRIAA